MVRYNNNWGGWNNRGVLREMENSSFLGKHVSVIYLIPGVSKKSTPF